MASTLPPISMSTVQPKGAPSKGGAKAPMPPRGLLILSWILVAYNVLVVLWGAVVRSTGSGNGCGEHWPLCNGTVSQKWQTVASMIEFAHRASAGVDVVLLAGMVTWLWRTTPKRHWARFFAGASVVLTLNEALVGALLVKFGLTAENQSPWRAAALSLHLANTLLLLAALALTAHFLGRAVGRMRGGTEWRHLAPAGVSLFVTLLVGVTGSLAALGDTLYPVQSLRAAFAEDFSSSIGGGDHWLLHIRWIHPALAVIAAFCLLGLAGKSRAWGGGRLGAVLAGLLSLQMALGVADVLLLAPTWIQIVHLLGADLLWIALVVLSARVCMRPVGCAVAGCALGREASQSAARPVEPAAV